MKIKLIMGFRRDQERSVDADEAHKAYHLFLHPEERGVFSNGLAIKGDQIQEIVPDYQGSMGWNPTHVIDNDDMNEIRNKGVDVTLRNLMAIGKEIAQVGSPQDFNVPLTQLTQKYPKLNAAASPRGGETKRLGELM